MNKAQPTRILILYTELAGYTVASIKALHGINTEVCLVRWPVNAEAPFDFDFGDGLKIHDRKNLTDDALLKIAEDFKPEIIICSGWSDKGYMRVCRSWRSRIPVVLAMDNKWNAGPRQQIARVISRFTILKSFTHCWVPGEQQKIYAGKLGFKSEVIKTGFYTCDTDYFDRIYQAQRAQKEVRFPHVFVYAARYYEFKGIKELWSAFAAFKKQTNNDWKLICLGTGDIEPIMHPDIEHKGFVQPKELEQVMLQTGVFILPSRFEPWAVAVQEFAAAGFPLLLSDAVGAKEAFLESGINGFTYAPNNEVQLLEQLKRVSSCSDEQLLKMGARSHELALRNTPALWAQTLLSFLTK